MEKIFWTPRLKLTVLETDKDGSDDLKWMHELRSDEQATSWSIHGKSKTLEDTKKFMAMILPSVNPEDGDLNRLRVAFAIHKIIEEIQGDEGSKREGVEPETKFIGGLTLRPHQAVPLPDNFTVPNGPETGVLRLEIGYAFLPGAWGSGYSTEALMAALDAYKQAINFWSPFSKLYVEAIVGPDNPASVKVLEKAGLKSLGLYKWPGGPEFLAGAWRERAVLVYGKWLVK